MRIFQYSILFSFIIILISLYRNTTKPMVKLSYPDQCISCHQNTTNIDNAHPIEIFGCYKCHGGNKFATNKKDAHEGIVLTPSRLEYANRFCAECHDEIINNVKKSIMQSQNGILNTLKFQWGELSSPIGFRGIEDIRNDVNKTISLAESHFRKGCASCHVNQDESIFNDEKNAKGGGCVDCHRIEKGHKEGDKYIHSKLSSIIPSKNCLKCHNRSNRIGLSYMGKFESEGYGTPYKHGAFTHKLDSTRFYYDLPADIHYAEAKLDCIDCHTQKGVMGDGQKHNHMEEAEDIKCKDCHKPRFKQADKLAIKLIDTNGKVPFSNSIAYSGKKNSPIYNLQKNDDNITFYRKRDAKKFNLTKMSDKSYHVLNIHKRLDCTSCHSTWMPSCYGCHEVYFEDGEQFDWVEKKMTKGSWQEFRSFLRFEKPSLGIGYNKQIMPFAPGCQVIGTVFKDKKIEHFHAMAMAGWDPHTTQKETRTCVDCHFSPESIGLGRGNLDIKNGDIFFKPFYNSFKSGMPFSYPIDGFVSKDGKQFQTTSRKYARSFNKQEIKRVVEAYKCIICHDKYDDKIYIDFNKSKKLFYNGKTKCLD